MQAERAKMMKMAARTQVWALGDAAWTAVCVAAAPRVLLRKTLEEDPREYLQTAVVLVLVGRVSWFYGLWPRHAAYAKSAEAARAFLAQTAAAQTLGTLVLHVGLVLFGAPFLQMADRTFLCAALLASLAVLPFAWVSWRSSIGGPGRFAQEALDYFVHGKTATEVDRVVFAQLCGTLAGAWAGALPIPLDWDRPWQAWPVTIVYGAAAGFIAGSATGVLQNAVRGDLKKQE